MKLGTRVTVVTTALVAPVLAASGYAALKLRRADLEADLDQQAREVAETLRSGLEPVSDDPDATMRVLTERAWMSRERDDAFKLEVLRVGDRWQTTDQSWLILAQAAEIEDGPVGNLLEAPGREPAFAMAVPLQDVAGMASAAAPPGAPAQGDAGHAARRALRQGRRDGDGEVESSRCSWARWCSWRSASSSPCAPSSRCRCAACSKGSTASSKGDLSRVLLADRDDEIGTIAGRFNDMTGSLREAREDGERGVQARLSLETRLRQSEKLATIGQMAAEIAHEVGTPLNVIGGRARALGKSHRASDPAEVTRNAGIITGEVDRIAKIIRQVLDFSRQRGPTITSVHLGSVVAEALEFLREIVDRQAIKTDVRVLPSPPEVPGDPDQIQQVCLNLLMNAIHAMPSGGTLRITAERVTRRKEGLDLASPAPYAMLEIADTGPGIPPENRGKIFEPFFTTKDEGQGTGLGLAVSHGIVKDHDGWIEVDSPTEGGAVFRVFLPCAAGAAGATGEGWRAAAPEETSPGLPRAVGDGGDKG